MMNRKPIGIFDSGVGGLTVLKEIEKLLPKENLIYFGDNQRAPYGSRTTEEILKFSFEIGLFLQELGAKMLIIACNTATAVSLNELSKRLDIPVIGVIRSGALEAVRVTENKKIGVFSTPVTAKMNAYKDKINEIDKSIEVYQVGCKLLCKMIESEWEDTKENQQVIKGYVDKLEETVDVVVFGCTHYPIIKEYFLRELKGKKLIDPAKETALKVEDILAKKHLLNEKDLKGNLTFYTSGDTKKFKKLAESILNHKVNEIKQGLNN